QGNAVRDFTKWDDQPASVDGIPSSFARGYRVAMTEPQGPVYLCYDAQLQEDPLDRPIPLPSSDSSKIPTRMAADRAALDHLTSSDRPLDWRARLAASSRACRRSASSPRSAFLISS